MTLHAHDVPRPRPGQVGDGAAGRLRAIDTLLADRGQLFRALFLTAPVPKALVGLDGHFLVVNEALCALTGRTHADLVGRHVDLLAHPDEAPVPELPSDGSAELDPWLRLDGERQLRRADGSELFVQQAHEVVHRSDGRPHFVVLSFVDVTDRRRAEEDLVRRAFTDPLTGLPNRRALGDRLNHALALSKRRGLQVGLVHLDLDRFQAVNDALGHEAGDHVLTQVADRLRWSTRVEDTAVRLGGDEFLILAEDVEDLDGLRALADRLLSVLDDPFVVGGREIVLSASVGLTLGSDVAPDDLLRQAHGALTRAKSDGSRARIEVYDGVLSDDEIDQLQLSADLRHALEGDELRLFYQPIVSLADETLLGYEALIRWQHPTRGLLPPGAFLACAEDNRLTSKLGAWVLHQACHDAAGWPAGLRVHVNISARHLAEPGFSDLVIDALAVSGLPPERLELEITESTALFAADATLQAVSEVTDHGVTLALDDFGTGYSAITALHRLPIHTVKIDRSFVADVVTQPSTAALVQGLVQLGLGMGLQVIAEGIEDLDQADWLREHGCAMAQGFAFGRPAPLPGRTGTAGEDAVVAQLVPAEVRNDEPLTAEGVIVGADTEVAALAETTGEVLPFRPPVLPGPVTVQFDARAEAEADDTGGADAEATDTADPEPVLTPRTGGLPDVPHLYAVLDDTGETPPVRE
ncbi:putative bifunctional diguanylate cyclase/phosphodiesterase [Trujillonella endophytica]|uniref:PAS domain S-box-containing protein/diguanylate cyclase (GGDEF) domain-containing protein n=1 Tax=Trujillonella endophytica TaxID=673521 RepID=A0A1H8R4E8_9ACTN|nr:EAL domain-containing protein [Trujillella endophytica]SEO61216.1 PAS domain S-box-containing protein/diguanylate cyclase (GGDEF) domain-containing protein [Trujillella endophytica]